MVAALTTVDEIRAEGISDAATNEQIALAIGLASQYIGLITRQPFGPVAFTDDKPLVVDGSGYDSLRLPFPILSITKVLEADNPLDLRDLVLYQGMDPWQDDRTYPRITKKAVSNAIYVSGDFGAGYAGGYPRAPRWARLRGGVKLSGIFGWVENDAAWLNFASLCVGLDSVIQWAVDGAVGNLNTVQLVGDGGSQPVTVSTTDLANGGGTGYVFHFQPGVSTVADFETAVTGAGLQIKAAGATPSKLLVAGDAMRAPAYLSGSPPPIIKRVAQRLVFRGWRHLGDPLERLDRSHAQTQSETTDGHSYSLSGLLASMGLTGDPEIDDALSYYRPKYGGNTGGYR